MAKKSARQTALELLIKSDRSGAFSNLVLDAVLSQSPLSAQDKRFVSVLYYGVLERKITLDHIISGYSRIRLEKISVDILNIIRLGLYQLSYLDHVPDSAAVNESVKLVEIVRKKSAKGFVNAILRQFIRDQKVIRYPDQETERNTYLSVFYSCPEWLVKRWIADYGLIRTQQILSASLGAAPITLRVNTQKITAKDLSDRLMQEGVHATLHPTVSDCLILHHGGDLEQLMCYRDGLFHVQDIASQICCRVLDPQPGETVLDVCAAPGGKTFTTAQLMQNKGRVIACDLYPKRTCLIDSGAKRLGLSVVETKTANAAEYDSAFCGADRVLCDLPCAGLGVIRRKPEIKYKTAKELDKLPEIQYNILCNVSRYLKKGGRLVYSTCSLSQAENEQVVRRFLASHPNFFVSPVAADLPIDYEMTDGMLTLFPQPNGSDGFFIAVLQNQSK